MFYRLMVVWKKLDLFWTQKVIISDHCKNDKKTLFYKNWKNCWSQQDFFKIEIRPLCSKCISAYFFVFKRAKKKKNSKRILSKIKILVLSERKKNALLPLDWNGLKPFFSEKKCDGRGKILNCDLGSTEMNKNGHFEHFCRFLCIFWQKVSRNLEKK